MNQKHDVTFVLQGGINLKTGVRGVYAPDDGLHRDLPTE
jgi:hypothetical protein